MDEKQKWKKWLKNKKKKLQKVETDTELIQKVALKIAY